MQKQNPNNQSFSFSIDNQNDIIASMGQKINDLSLSISTISQQNELLQKKLSQSQIFQIDKKNFCPNDHPMRYLLISTTKNAQNKLCDQCNIKVDNSTNVFWRCQKCDYDLCSGCGGRKKTTCPFGHNLQYTTKYPHNYFSCDVCNTKSLKSGWHCQCNFDLCQNCFNSP